MGCGTALLLILCIAAPLSAQSRDSLLAGRRAYERAELADAARLLPIGLVASAERDTAWVSGAHMLLDALLEDGRDSLAALWARWALRLAPGMRVDSNVFPPRVARVFAQARTVAAAPLDSTAPARVTFEPMTGPPSPRGTLRFTRGSNADFAVIEGIGTVLQGESRGVPAGTYAVRFGGAGAPVHLEVLPGIITVVTSRPAAVVAARPAPPPPAPPPVPVREVVAASAGNTTCVIITAGNPVCWGDNRTGQLGGGFLDSLPGMVVGERELAGIAVGGAHVCGLTTAGVAWCWGLGVSGQLGSGAGGVPGVAPVQVSGNRTFVQIVAGGAHTCGLTPAGTAFCWGGNRGGELGNRSESPSPVPTAVAAPQNLTFTSLTAGGAHTCGLASNGTAWCWGSNENGQLGNGNTNQSSHPVQVHAQGTLRTVKAGNAHTCALNAAGQALCWGANTSGQLGDAHAESQSRPALVSGGLTFASLESGEQHTCGLTTEGATYCWGAGRRGQLGNGGTSDSPRPVLVVGGHTFRHLALGLGHSCGVTDTRTTFCWGDNAAGQTGALAGRGTAVPVPMILRPPALSLAVGTLPRLLRETFDDGNFTTGPAWLPDPANGARISAATNELVVTRGGSRGQLAAAGAGTMLRVPVRRETVIEFDVRVDSAAPRGGCGLNCASWPAIVRVRVRNSDLTEGEAWFAYGFTGGKGGTLGGLTIVGKGDVTPGQWLRSQRFTIRDVLPRADTILQVSVGGVGTDYAARFDNISLPAGLPASIVLRPDTVRFVLAGDTMRLTPSIKDSAGTALPWIPITWASSDTLVARVDDQGLVTSVSAGRAIIRASSGRLTTTAVVTVRPPRAAAPPRRARP